MNEGIILTDIFNNIFKPIFEDAMDEKMILNSFLNNIFKPLLKGEDVCYVYDCISDEEVNFMIGVLTNMLTNMEADFVVNNNVVEFSGCSVTFKLMKVLNEK